MDDFVLTTDYAIDQYTFYGEGSVTAAAFNLSLGQIQHGLPYIPLIYVQWSETSDFAVPRELWQNTSDMHPLSEPYNITAEADGTFTTFRFLNLSTSSKTIYYRIWGLPPHNATQETPHTAGVTGLAEYVANTDMNYLKLYMAGIVNVPPSSQATVSHSLGYLPVVMLWREYTLAPPMIEPLFSPIASAPTADQTPSVTTSSIVFPPDGFSTMRYHYRIYLDGIA